MYEDRWLVMLDMDEPRGLSALVKQRGSAKLTLPVIALSSTWIDNWCDPVGAGGRPGGIGEIECRMLPLRIIEVR